MVRLPMLDDLRIPVDNFVRMEMNLYHEAGRSLFTAVSKLDVESLCTA